MKHLLLILLLTSLNCFAIPPDWANNPDADDMPDNANCSFCNDDEPEEEAPVPQGIFWFAAGVLFMKLYDAKKKCENELHRMN